MGAEGTMPLNRSRLAAGHVLHVYMYVYIYMHMHIFIYACIHVHIRMSRCIFLVSPNGDFSWGQNKLPI